MICDVYFNLTKKLYSIKHKGKVIGHAKSVSMRDVQFRVLAGGRNRVLRDKQKNVHAYARGFVVQAIGDNFSLLGKSIDIDHAKTNGKRVTYCPYRSDKFQTINQEGFTDIETATELLLDIYGNRYAIE